MDLVRSRQLALAGSAVTLALAVGLVGPVGAIAAAGLHLAANAFRAELLLLSLTLGGAWATLRRPSLALGWEPGRLSAPTHGLLILATLGLSHALDGTLTLLDLRDQSAVGAIGEALAGIRGVELAAALVAVGLMPAIAEELLCRGLVQRSLLERFGPGVAIAGSSLLFAALHGEVTHALLAAPLGVHLGIIAWWGGSTRPAMLCHALNNVGAVCLGVWGFDLPGPPLLHLAMGGLLAALGWTGALRVQRRN